MSFSEQFAEIILCAEARIDFVEAGGVVAMIAGAGENGRQPQAVDSQTGDVIEFGSDAAQGLRCISGWVSAR